MSKHGEPEEDARYWGDLQERLDRIGRWDEYAIDWPHFHELAALPIGDLCALSVNMHPAYVRLVDEVLVVDKEDFTQAELTAKAAYRNGTMDEAQRRLRVAMNHAVAGAIPVIGALGSANNTIVNIAHFRAWATGMGWHLPNEFHQNHNALAAEAPAVTRAAPQGVSDDELTAQIRQLASDYINAEFKADRHPSQEAIGDYVARILRERGTMGKAGAPLAGAYIKRHYLKGISAAKHRRLSTAPRQGK